MTFRSGSLKKKSLKFGNFYYNDMVTTALGQTPELIRLFLRTTKKQKQAGRKLEASCLLASFFSVGRCYTSHQSRKIISDTQLWSLPAIAMPDISRNAHWCNSSKNIIEVPNLFPDWLKSHSTRWNTYLIPLSDQELIATQDRLASGKSVAFRW